MAFGADGGKSGRSDSKTARVWRGPSSGTAFRAEGPFGLVRRPGATSEKQPFYHLSFTAGEWAKSILLRVGVPAALIAFLLYSSRYEMGSLAWLQKMGIAVSLACFAAWWLVHWVLRDMAEIERGQRLQRPHRHRMPRGARARAAVRRLHRRRQRVRGEPPVPDGRRRVALDHHRLGMGDVLGVGDAARGGPAHRGAVGLLLLQALGGRLRGHRDPVVDRRRGARLLHRAAHHRRSRTGGGGVQVLAAFCWRLR